MEARNRSYTMFGSVQRPSAYYIADDEYRLLDALTAAGDTTSPLLQDLYIFRRTDLPRRSGAAGGSTTQPARGGAGTQPADDITPPQSNSGRLPVRLLKKTVLLQEQAAGDALAPEGAAEVVIEDDAAAARVGRIDGQEVVVQPGDGKNADTVTPVRAEGDVPAAAKGNAPFEFNEVAAPDNIRVIRIPLAKLRAGEFQYNVAIRPKDQIYVPPGQVGFYYMGGHVVSGGPYTFSGAKITLKQAITAAKGLDGLAIPQRTDIIRRVGANEEMYVRVDLAHLRRQEPGHLPQAGRSRACRHQLPGAVPRSRARRVPHDLWVRIPLRPQLRLRSGPPGSVTGGWNKSKRTPAGWGLPIRPVVSVLCYYWAAASGIDSGR